MIGMPIARQNPKRHVLMRRLLNLARRHLADAVPVYQQLHHHHRMIRRSSASIAALVAPHDRAQIQRVHHIAYKQRQMPLRQPLLQICRQQQLLLWIVAQVDSAHTSHYNSSSSLFSQKSLGLFRQAPRIVTYESVRLSNTRRLGSSKETRTSTRRSSSRSCNASHTSDAPSRCYDRPPQLLGRTVKIPGAGDGLPLVAGGARPTGDSGLPARLRLKEENPAPRHNVRPP